MSHGVHEFADGGDDVELFEELAAQRLDVCLTFVDLAAGKLPMAREVRAGLPQRQQERAITLDDRCYHCNRREDARPGTRRHFGPDAPTGTG